MTWTAKVYVFSESFTWQVPGTAALFLQQASSGAPAWG